MNRRVTAKFVTEVTVRDPDTGGDVQVEIWKDPQSGGIFGVDASFLDDEDDTVPSPFDEHVRLWLPCENLDPDALRSGGR